MRTHHYLSLLFHIIYTSILFSVYCQEEPETSILLRIKSEWGNPRALDSWNTSSDDHCTWLGINCTGGVVTSVRLINQSLTQPIPDSICLLKSLSYLDLSNNELPGPFPQFLYNCSSLQHLNISENFFVGTLPTDIDKLPSSLTYFDVSGNNFTGQIPTSIGRLASLKQLYLDGNLFNGTYPLEIANLLDLECFSLAWNPFLKPARIPDEFGNLTKLKTLWMTQTNTIGEIPIALSKLTELERLDLGWNQINGTLPSWIWSLEKLNILYLFSNDLTGDITFNGSISCLGLSEIDVSLNNLTGSIPESFSNLQNLSILYLYFNFFTGEIPASLGLLPNLTDIRLFNNNLTGQLPETLGKYSKLWDLEINDNRLSGRLPAHLCSGNNLVSIVVFNNYFTGEIPASLANCNTLNDIQLYNNRFYGEFPSNIWSISSLSTILIHDNGLTGMLPRSLPWNLTRLEIHNNYFTGEIPTFADRLQVFKASNNNFHGELPNNFIGLSRLLELSLGSNKIIGSISQNIQVLKSLTTLNLSSNKLTGSIPDSIGSLPVLTTLDLSNNELSGSIPEDLSKLNPTFLNLSANNLSGVIPQSFNNQVYNRSFLYNPGLCTDSNSNTILNLPVCNLTLSSSNKLSRELIAIFATLGFVILVGIGIVGFLLIRSRIKGKTASYDETAWKLTSFHKFDFTEDQITNGLKEENVIGSGGSGIVYKISLNNGEDQIVAVKRIFVGRKMDCNLEKNFNAEVNILGQIRHANIVKLLCCISSMDSKLLVYEYMENSSLDRWLYGKERMHGSQPLDWPTRLGIAIDAAKGLCYMHHSYSQPIMHRDIKSSNILLDMKFRAKIADFGLARVLEKSGEPETVSAIQGSFGYIAPECGKKRKINEKVDVYSFGVVLLELTTGKRANEGDEFEALSDWALRLYVEHGMLVDMIDQDIRNSENLPDIITVFELGLRCTLKDPITRPNMKMVLQCLSKCDPTNNIRNGFCNNQFDEAPLILSKKGSRRNMSDDFHEDNDDDDDDDYSGSFVVHVS
ncbi:hypothetical protein LUZ61_015590 [Rhynchospora tenuis]|uniref:non-specific serine/threonine protein kinase n=1 Tax=Rhynchospora tenuis TaxID=198213 RepID=A0AAD5Z3Y2_9POAL|nr:hypothetical protein LUZ61_015590 [Rhynchospora tenuis]